MTMYFVDVHRLTPDNEKYRSLARLRRAADPEAADLAAGCNAFDLIDRVGCAGGPAQRLAVEAQREVADAVIGLIAGAVRAAADLDEKSPRRYRRCGAACVAAPRRFWPSATAPA